MTALDLCEKWKRAREAWDRAHTLENHDAAIDARRAIGEWMDANPSALRVMVTEHPWTFAPLIDSQEWEPDPQDLLAACAHKEIDK